MLINNIHDNQSILQDGKIEILHYRYNIAIVLGDMSCALNLINISLHLFTRHLSSTNV